jgi:predicted alpha-1,2-mannosidase
VKERGRGSALRPRARVLALVCFVTSAAGCGKSSDATASNVDAGADAQVEAGADAPTDAPLTSKPPSPPVAPAFIGSGGFGYNFGSVFVGAAAPNGLAKVGPDTVGPWGDINFLHYSGYWYGDDTITAFSHMHLSGTGATDYGVIGVMPVSSFDASKTKDAGHSTKFDKSSEQCDYAHYGVTLADAKITADFTATAHAAHEKYGFPGASVGHLVFDLDHHLVSGAVSAASFTLSQSDGHIVGKLHSMGQMSKGFGGYDVYFDAYVKKPWTGASVWHDGGAPAAGTAASGAGVGFVLDFDTSDGAPVELRIGVSLVSAAGAAANLAAEIPAFDWAGTLAKNQAAWAARDGAIVATGGADGDAAMLTAAIRHSFLMPSYVSDADGSYVAMDGSVQKATDFHYVSDLSLWDTYRTVSPFYATFAPPLARDVVRTLVAMGQVRGSFPRWPIATGESGTMIGDPAEIVIADGYARGVTDFDTAAAWSLLDKVAVDPSTPAAARGGRDDYDDYVKVGYVPASRGGSVSRTVENVRADDALAGFAAAMGQPDAAMMLTARSHSWRALYDASSQLLWAKSADGSWATSHGDPTAFSSDFVEGDANQYAWSALHDVPGYVSLFGGQGPFTDALENLFEQALADYVAIDWSDVLGSAAPRPYYWAGNEPDIHAVYLFTLAGRPDRTQRWTRWLYHTLYGPGADGLPGNDDGGTMSANWAFGAIGLYPIAGSDRFVVTTPLFSHVVLAVPGGSFTIDAPGVSDTNCYLQSVTLNGAPLTAVTLRQRDLVAGGSLVMTLASTPGAWGMSH